MEQTGSEKNLENNVRDPAGSKSGDVVPKDETWPQRTLGEECFYIPS
jgi:hypothetical protein